MRENGRGGDVLYRRRDDALVSSPAATDDGEDWSGWERWLRGHLDIERDAIGDQVGDAIGELIREERATTDRDVNELKRGLAELRGEVRALRTGKSLRVRGTFIADARYEFLDVVAVNGSSFIAREDNPGECPGGGWQLLASAGRRGARGFSGPKGRAR